MKLLRKVFCSILILVLLFNIAFCQGIFAYFYSIEWVENNVNTGSVEVDIRNLIYQEDSLVINTGKVFSFTIINEGKSKIDIDLYINLSWDNANLFETDMFYIYPSGFSDESIIDNLQENDYSNIFDGDSFSLDKNEQKSYSLKLFFFESEEIMYNPSLYNEQSITVSILTLADVSSRDTLWSTYKVDSFKTVSFINVVTLPPVERFVKLVSGNYHALALTNFGNVYVWGRNSSGELGDGLNQPRTTPYLLPNLSDIVDIAANKSSSYALTSDGRVLAWGHNGYGHLGDGTTTDRRTPVEVLLPDVRFVSISAAYNTAGAVSEDGDVYTWGYGGNGTLGRDSLESINPYPQKIDVSNVKQLEIGDTEGAVLTYDGKIYVWGASNHGQLGIGVYNGGEIYEPTQLNYFSDRGYIVKDISVGFKSMSAVTQNGDVYTWGYGYNGCLGDGTENSKSIPTKIDIPFNAVEVFSKNENRAIIDSDGFVYVLGANYSNKLGDNGLPEILIPTILEGAYDITSITFGADATLILMDSVVYGIGSGAYGMLATGNTNSSNQLIEWEFELPL